MTEHQYCHSRIEINAKALISNIIEFRKILHPKTRIMAVLKANAYGHGAIQIAQLIENHVDLFQVDDIQELEEIRQVSAKKTLVLGYVMEKDLELLVDLEGTLGIYSARQAILLNDIGKKKSKQIPIHICVDSHLGRDGILPDTLNSVLREITTLPYIKIEGYYSHFANIEDTEDRSHAELQIETFNKVKEIFRKFGLSQAVAHISATSGILEYEQNLHKHSIVRLGIGLYGIWPSEGLKAKYQNKITLTPVMQVKSIIAQIKTLPPSHTVGYGLTFVTPYQMRIGIVPFGYSDGIPRSLSNKGYVLVRGIRCKIIGRISMNMMTIDLENVPEAKVEDEVVIMGAKNQENISAEEIAALDNSINYEILTNFSPRLTRVVI